MKTTRFIIIGLCSFFIYSSSFAASVVATVSGNPVTDADITARTKLMAKQGKVSTDNRRQALQNIIDDYVKLSYASTLKIKPSDKEVKKSIESMNMGELSSVQSAMAKMAVTANLAWQMVISRTIVPTVDIDDTDITTEKKELESTHGLPIEITLLRLVNIPKNIAEKLTKPDNCENAMKIANDLGGDPQKITAKEYELSKDVLQRIAGLNDMTWSEWQDESVFLICNKKKTNEYGDLDDVIKQNAMYKKAMFTADQQLKQLRRKAVIIINDNRYKL